MTYAFEEITQVEKLMNKNNCNYTNINSLFLFTLFK